MLKKIRICSTFLLSLLLCIVVAFAWFVMNDEANVKSIIMNVGYVGYEQEMYHYDANATTKWQIQSSAFSFKNFVPGDVEYFALVISSPTEDFSLNMSFSGIESTLIENLPYVVTDTMVKYADESDVLYEVKAGKVEVNGKTLYNVIDQKLTLADYLIEDVFLTYICDKGQIDLNNSYVPTIEGKTDIKDLKERIVSNERILSKEATYTIVFALEFNDEASTVLGDSNCYQYQKLSINSIILSAETLRGDQDE